MVTHTQKAQALRDEFELATGAQHAYPWSHMALNDLSETLERYNAAMANFKINDADLLAEKKFADKFDRLGILPSL